MRLLCLVIFAACSTPRPPAAPPSPPPPKPTAEAANAAYDAKQYASCTTMFEARADHYNAACCAALDGKPDRAFALLDRAALREPGNLASDTDLASLRADPRWTQLLAAIHARGEAWERTLGAPALRRELLELVVEDQRVRFARMKDMENPALRDEMAAVDARRTARMKEVIAQHGWPGKSLVGEDGAHAAWLFVQHADADVAFQKQCLALMEPLVAKGEVTPADHGYLHDRVAVNENRPQRYGTQFGPDSKPRPIEDEAHVDARRAAIGLSTMAEYSAQMKRMTSKN